MTDFYNLVPSAPEGRFDGIERPYSPEDVKRQFPKASVVAGNRIVFNIAGNAYRLVVSFEYRHRAGYVKFFGSHADYDRIDAATVDQT